MTRKELTTYLAAILTSLADFPEGTPESNLYIAIGMDLQKWETVSSILTDNKWIKISSHWVTITPAGRAVADEVNSLLATAN